MRSGLPAAPVMGVGRGLVLLVIAAMCALLVTAIPAVGQASPEQQRAEAERRIAELGQQLAGLESQRDGQAADVQAAAATVNGIEQVLNEALERLAAQEAATLDVRDEVAETQAEVDARRQVVSRRVRTAYQGGGQSVLSAVMSAGNITEATGRATLANRLVGNERADLELLAVSEAQLEDQLDLLAIEEAQLEDRRTEQESLLAQAANVLAGEQEALARVTSQTNLLASQREDLEDESDRLGEIIAAAQARRAAAAAAAAAAVEQAAAAAAAAAAASAPAPVAPAPASAAQPAPAAPPASVASGTGYIWPVCSRVTSEYGPRWGRQHKGIDIDGNTGDSIRAANNGVVLSSGRGGGYGLLTLVDHGDGVVTAYAHQSSTAVSRGQVVTRGQVIGRIGTSGNVTGSHLHYETRVNGGARNPRNYLPRGC